MNEEEWWHKLRWEWIMGEQWRTKFISKKKTTNSFNPSETPSEFIRGHSSGAAYIGDPRSWEGNGKKPPRFVGDESSSAGFHGLRSRHGLEDGRRPYRWAGDYRSNCCLELIVFVTMRWNMFYLPAHCKLRSRNQHPDMYLKHWFSCQIDVNTSRIALLSFTFNLTQLSVDYPNYLFFPLVFPKPTNPQPSVSLTSTINPLPISPSFAIFLLAISWDSCT